MKRAFCSLALSVAVTGAQAASFVNQPVGSNLTYGHASNPQNIVSEVSNPAAAAMGLTDEGFVHFGLLTNLGVGVEYGQVDNIFNVINDKAKAYSDGLNLTLPTLPADPTDPVQVNQFLTELQATIDVPVQDLNSVLATVARDGYAKVFANGTLPVLPLSFGSKAMGGVLTVDISGALTGKSTTLQDYIDIDYADVQNQLLSGQTTLDLGEAVVDVNTGNFTVTNDTTLVTDAASLASISLGFSRALNRSDRGVLLGGVRASYYQAGWGRAATRLGSLTDADQILDDIRNTQFNYDSNFGIDLGVVWTSEHYQLGATVTDVNEPTFTFPGITGLAARGYRVGGEIFNSLAGTYSYQLKRQYKLEAGLFSADRHWVLNATYDANAIPDPFGDDYQWATVSGGYFTESWIIPGIRAGYRVNLAGEQMNYGTLGLTLFRVLQVDVAMALNNVTIEGTTVPRGAMLNLGLHIPL